MQVLYKSKKVEKYCINKNNACATFGELVAKEILKIIYLIEATPNLTELSGSHKRLKIKALKGALGGKWSLRIKDSGIRMIFAMVDKQLTIIEIEGVNNHYGD